MNIKKINLLMAFFGLFISINAQPPEWVTVDAVSDYYFIENIGQIHTTDGLAITDIRFISGHGTAAAAFFDKGKVAHLNRNYAVLGTHCRVDIIPAGVTGATAIGYMLTDEITNYYDEYLPNGVLGAKNYEGIMYEDVFPGINIYYSSNRKGITTYYEITPDGDAASMKFRLEGQSALEISETGAIVASTDIGEFVFNQLEAYQYDNSTNSLVALGWQPAWTFTGVPGEVALSGFGDYNTTQPLYFADKHIPNPNPGALVTTAGLEWSTRYGAGDTKSLWQPGINYSHEYGGTIRVDKVSKDIYHTMTRPKDNLFPPVPGCEQTENGGGNDIYITKFNGNNYKRLWSTYFGGAGDENCRKTALSYNSVSDFLYLTGFVKNGNVPMPGSNLGTFIQANNHGGKDAFVASFDKSSGWRQWVTHFGGSGDDEGMSITIDDIDHKLYITGYSSPSGISVICNTPGNGNFPLCSGSGGYFQDNYGTSNQEKQAFVAQFDIDQNYNSLDWSTLFGGNEMDISFDVLKVNSGSTKALYIAGMTRSGNSSSSYSSPVTTAPPGGDFPFANPGSCYFQHTNALLKDDEAFISKFDDNHNLIWSTQFGGGEYQVEFEQFTSLALNTDNLDVYAVGLTSTKNAGGNNCAAVNNKWWPTCPGSASAAFHQTQIGGSTDLEKLDVMITRFSQAGELKWSTYFGGSGLEYRYGNNNVLENMVCAKVDDLQNLYVYGTSSWRRTPALPSPSSVPTKNVPYGIHGTYYNQSKNASENADFHINSGSDAFLAAFNQANVFAYGTYFGGWSNFGGTPTADGQADEIARDFDIYGHEAVYITGQQASYGTPVSEPPKPGYFAYFDLTPGDWNNFITRLTVESWFVSTGIDYTVPGSEPEKDKTAVISPNPMVAGTAVATVELEAESPATVGVTIYDMLGKQYYAGNFTLVKGNNQLPVDISNANMAAGMYTVKIAGTAINKNILLIVK